MTENNSKKQLLWTEEHDAFCYQHHIPPAAKSLWQWLIRQSGIGEEMEPDLSEFNTWVGKVRGKSYSHNYLKKMFDLLCEHRVIQTFKQYSWKIFKLLVRPLDWLKPPRKKREKNLQNSNSSYEIPAPNNDSVEPCTIQQQHSTLISNQEALAAEGIHFDQSETEVLDRPPGEIKASILLFKVRGGTNKIENPEGWIRTCLRRRYWESPRNHLNLCKALAIEAGLYNPNALYKTGIIPHYDLNACLGIEIYPKDLNSYFELEELLIPE